MIKFLKKHPVIFCLAFMGTAIIYTPLCMLAFGSWFFYLGASGLVALRRIRSTGVECAGKVVSFESDNDGGKYPVVEFIPLGGTTVTAKPTIVSSWPVNLFGSFDDDINTSVTV